MRINKKKKPRKFLINKKIKLKDMGYILLKNDEQITFIHGKNQEYDVCKKNWGFYATPSINSRLKKNDFFTYIVENKKLQRFGIHIVDKKKINLYKKYLKNEKLKIVNWPKKLRKYI